MIRPLGRVPGTIWSHPQSGESKWCQNGAFYAVTFLQHATMDYTRMKPESLSVDLESLSLTPELLAQHSITAEEYQRIVAALGRPPG